MPRNGDTNKKFGVYKNLCCNEEIVIPEGATFPDCSKHPRLTTQWKPLLTDKPIVHVSELTRKKDSAA